uniref:Fructose-2 6-bisphosphatase n=1 Tax=Rhizophora mucronata TaxID=61149 RepID=A0A2P2MUU3_RHIMU
MGNTWVQTLVSVSCLISNAKALELDDLTSLGDPTPLSTNSPL